MVVRRYHAVLAGLMGLGSLFILVGILTTPMPPQEDAPTELSSTLHAQLRSQEALLASLPSGSGVATPEPVPLPLTEDEKPPAKPKPVRGPGTLTLLLGGDIIPHERVSGMALDYASPDPQTGVAAAFEGWSAPLQPLVALLKRADLTMVNLETPVAQRRRSIPGYPLFNAPSALLLALADAGVDVVSFANNHVYDQGREGLEETLMALEKAKLGVVGAGMSRRAASAPVRFQAGDLSLCVLAATRWLNDELQRGENEPGVQFIPYGAAGKSAQALLEKQVQQARSQCEVVLISLHWGTEYSIDPRSEDRRLAQTLLEAGADGILGHHPHTVQPLERVRLKGGREGFVAYSVGNLLASMVGPPRGKSSRALAADPRYGLLVEARFRREKPGAPVKLESVGYHALMGDRYPRPGERNDRRIARTIVMEQERQELEGLVAFAQQYEADDARRYRTVMDGRMRLEWLAKHLPRLKQAAGPLALPAPALESSPPESSPLRPLGGVPSEKTSALTGKASLPAPADAAKPESTEKPPAKPESTEKPTQKPADNPTQKPARESSSSVSSPTPPLGP